MVRLMEGEQECNNRTQTQGSGLGQDKRTGTCGSHVIDGVEVFQEPGRSGRFLAPRIFHIYQWVERDLLVGATR